MIESFCLAPGTKLDKDAILVRDNAEGKVLMRLDSCRPSHERVWLDLFMKRLTCKRVFSIELVALRAPVCAAYTVYGHAHPDSILAASRGTVAKQMTLYT